MTKVAVLVFFLSLIILLQLICYINCATLKSVEGGSLPQLVYMTDALLSHCSNGIT